MKLMKRQIRIAAVLLMVFMSGILCSCGNRSEEEVAFPKTLETLTSGIIANNDTLSLEWDNGKYCLLLRQNNSDKIWSTLPYDVYQKGETDEDMSSPIYIEYIDNNSMVRVVSKGYTDSVANNRVASRIIDNGIELTYYFDNADISVPIQYRLKDDALEVTVDFEHIEEGQHRLLSVSVAPFLCSAQNQSENSYIVLPSGSGALMYLDERAEGTRTWSGEIYGTDPARLLPESLSSEETVRLALFGIKEGEDALLAIVEEGREAAVVTASAGDARTGYSNAYVSFYARGYDVLESAQNMSQRDMYRTEENISIDKATISFYPFSGEDADYTGMASFYQNYLIEAGMKEEEADEKSYALYIVGGGEITELFLGVPFAKTKALTTFSDAETILRELTEETGTAPAVQLKGFGESGLDIGKLAGGFKFSKVFGSDSQRLTLEDYCNTENIPLFTDFDLVYFSTSGSGYNTLLDVAKSASMRRATQYYKHKALWSYSSYLGDSDTYYMLKRDKLQSAVDKLEKLIEKKGVSAISLSTLGQTAYSDYSNEKYSVGGESVEDTQKYLLQLSQSNRKVATESANDYAAAFSDSVFETPLGNGGYTSLDVSIPLYQMIFKGYVSLYATAINTASNFDKSLMLAVQSGTSLGFSVVGEYNLEFSETEHTDLNASSYVGNKQDIVDAVLKCTDYYEAIQGQTITKYEFVSENVTKTSFSNGVVVYANHSDKSVQTPLGELSAYGFSYAEPEVKQ